MTAIRIIDSHLELADIGANTHAQIDTELSSLRDVSSAADSPMIISGGEISLGTAANTFKVATLTAMLRSADSSTGDLVAVSLAEQDSQEITLAETIYRVILNYGDGTPTISIGVDNPYDTDKRNIPIGRVMRDGGGVVHYLSSGHRLQDGVEKLHERARAVRDVELQSGSTIAYSGVDNFTMTEGIAYAGINRFELSSYNSAAVTFVPIYRAGGGGGWTEGVASNTIDTAHYDDGDGGLGDIGNNKYGNFWIYKHIEDNHVYALYGRDSYTLAEAEAAGEPSHPDHLSYFGLLIGKIIAPKLGGSFSLIQMVTDSHFTAVAASEHNNLGGLQGGTLAEYYHLTAAEHTNLAGFLANDQYILVDGTRDIVKDQNDITNLVVDNGTNGLAAKAAFRAQSDGGSVSLSALSGGHLTSFQYKTDSALLESDGNLTGGLHLSAVSGEIGFWQGNTRRGSIWSDGKWKIGSGIPTEILDVGGNIAVSGTVDGIDISGIEAGATADQTKIDIDGLGLSHDSLVDVSANDHHNELHSIVSHSDTSATGAQLDTLTDNSIADALHRHSELVASDGSPDPALSVNADGIISLPSQSSCGVKLTSNQTIPHNTWTKLTFGTVQWDNQDEYDETINYRFTATTAGKYLCCGTII